MDLPILIVGQTQLLPPCRRDPLSKRRRETRTSFPRPLERRSREGPDQENHGEQDDSLQFHPPQRLEMRVHCSLRSRPRRSPGVGLSFTRTHRAT